MYSYRSLEEIKQTINDGMCGNDRKVWIDDLSIVGSKFGGERFQYRLGGRIVSFNVAAKHLQERGISA